ncbi:MAG: NF038122 family metalloprotease [Planctomycetota bacterium]|nr:NF038122 family metalloprotease [Planctomycetota bacterium]
MLLAALMFWWIAVVPPPASAQWTLTYVVGEQNATAALGRDRVMPMRMSLDRARLKLESILSGSTGNARFVVLWENPSSPTAVANATVSMFHTATVAIAKDKLTNQATADNEPASEVLLYESLPASSIPFRFDTATTLFATQVAIPNALNKHLAFQPTTEQTDGTIRFRPPSPTLKWQFWPKRDGPVLPEYELFEAVAIHESLHLLGFDSVAEASTTPSTLDSWDLFRFADTSVPIDAIEFETLPRELRPTVDATAITLLGSTTKAYKLSRGRRTGGDGFQAAHWRSLSLLTPPTAIGVMDPGGSFPMYSSLGKRLYTRADVEALDVMGWNVNPDAVQYTAADPVNLVAPAATAQFTTGEAITFSWQPGPFNDWSVFITRVEEIGNDNPIKVFYQLPPETTSVILEAAESLPPGEYVWSVVGATAAGYADSEDRSLTILPACDPDINCDGNIDQDDIVCIVSAVGGDPTCACGDPDFNQDGNLDQEDVARLTEVVAGGPCP